MHSHSLGTHQHDHHFLGHAHGRHERSVRLVVGLSLVMMVVEVAAGLMFGSMALLADGLHMATHAGALAIAAAAYAFARRYRNDPRFSFGTGKVGDLAAFVSAIVLAATALTIAGESLHRLNRVSVIDYDEAIMVASIGLVVNLVGAWLLHDNHDHVAQSAGHHDHNHRAAYLHIVADALTSVLAIVALLVAWAYGWNWIDPAVGLLGALIIGRWSWQLMTRTAAVLVDATHDASIQTGIRQALEDADTRITDLHVWRLGPGHFGAIVAIVARNPLAPQDYKARIAHLSGLCHLTIETSHEASASTVPTAGIATSRHSH